MTEGDLCREINENIRRHMEIGTYRGIRSVIARVYQSMVSAPKPMHVHVRERNRLLDILLRKKNQLKSKDRV